MSDRLLNELLAPARARRHFLLEVRWSIGGNRLPVGIDAVLDDLFRVEERAAVGLGELHEPVERARRYPPSYGNGDVHRHALPHALVEQDDHLGVGGFHPVRQRAVVPPPAADELDAGVDGTVLVVVASLARAVRAGPTRVDRDAVDANLQPPVAARRARLAFTRCGVLCQDRPRTVSVARSCDGSANGSGNYAIT